MFLLFGIMLFSTAELSAQSACCKPQKACKPKVCCPTNPTCCSTTKVTTQANEEKEENQAPTSMIAIKTERPQSTPKKEEAIEE